MSYQFASVLAAASAAEEQCSNNKTAIGHDQMMGEFSSGQNDESLLGSLWGSSNKGLLISSSILAEKDENTTAAMIWSDFERHRQLSSKIGESSDEQGFNGIFTPNIMGKMLGGQDAGLGKNTAEEATTSLTETMLHPPVMIIAAEIPRKIDEVRFEELSKGLPKGRWTLIDCRNATELEDPGMIPGSYNIPLHEAVVAFKLTEQEFFERYGFKKPDPGNDRIVVSCRSGKRAEEFISKIRPLGYDNFKLYKGSFLDWIDRGGPVISKKPEKLQQQQPQQQQRVIQ